MASNPPASPQKVPPLAVPVWAWLFIFPLGGISINVFHDALLEPIAMAAYLAIGVALVLFFRIRGVGEQRSMVLVGWHALFLGVSVFLCSIFAWFVAEIASRGRSGEDVMWPARMGLTYFFGAVLLVLTMKCRSLIATVIQYARSEERRGGKECR